jgi:hypothetical protein
MMKGRWANLCYRFLKLSAFECRKCEVGPDIGRALKRNLACILAERRNETWPVYWQSAETKLCLYFGRAQKRNLAYILAERRNETWPVYCQSAETKLGLYIGRAQRRKLACILSELRNESWPVY